MKTLILLNIATILLLSHCNKSNAPAIPTYTVKGKIIGSSFTYVLNNAPVSLSAYNAQTYNNESVVSGTTDAYGNYELTYNEVTGNYNELTLFYGSLGNSIQGLPINQNLTRNISSSGSGNVAFMLYTNNPLEKSNDTLFLSYSIGNQNTIDTITSNVNGFYKIIQFPKTYTRNIYLLWSRLNKGLFYNPNKGFNPNSTNINFYVSGSPFIDTVTINY